MDIYDFARTNNSDDRKPFYIYTLGCFMVCSESNISIDILPRAQKFWDVFKYLLINKDRMLPAEVIIENLYQDVVYEDSKNAMQNLVYRLRKQLKDCLPIRDSTDVIQFQNGCYRLNTDYFDIDADDFEQMIKHGGKIKQGKPLEAIGCFSRAIELYHGDFLPELLYADWVVPIRNYYRRLYIQCCLDLCELLKKQHLHTELIKACEKVLLVEPYEEEIHACFLEALIHEGKLKEAHSHYEYITSTLYNKFGTKPSVELQKAYQLISFATSESTMDINNIQKLISSNEPDQTGAHICDPKVFRSLYTVNKNQSYRKGQPIYLLLVESNANSVKLNPIEIRETITVLAKSLRAGDAITQWSDTQVLILLADIRDTDLEKVIERLKMNIKQCNRILTNDIKIQAQPILPAVEVV